MPFRESTPDNGFTARNLPEVAPPTAPGFFEQLPGTIQNLSSAARLLNPISAASEIETNMPLATAAFNQDNAVVNAWQALTRPTFKPDPTFDVMAALKRDNLWDNYRDNFLNVRSGAEYSLISNKIVGENRDRETIARAGPAGLVMGAIAGLADPTTLLPLIGEGKGVLAVLKAMFLGGAAAAIDEIPLQLNQETRTATDTAMSVAGGTVFGGILGGAAVLLRRGAGESVADALDGLAKRIDNSPGEAAISAGPSLDEMKAELAGLQASRAEFTTPGFHGTNEIVHNFDPAQTRLGRGVFFSSDPKMANDFAFGRSTDGDSLVNRFDNSPQELNDFAADYLSKPDLEQFNKNVEAAQTGDETAAKQVDAVLRDVTANYDFPDEGNPVVGGRSPNVTPADLRLGKTFDYEFKTDRFDWDEEKAAIAEARAGGYDSVTFKLGDSKFYSVFDAKNIRNRFDRLKESRLQERIYEAERDFEHARAADEVDGALRESSGKGAAVGADVIERDAGALKGMLGIGERLGRIAGPVTANLTQRLSKNIRQMTAELSTAGLRLEKNVILDQKGNIIGSIPSNQGGTVESLVQMRRGEVLSVLNKSYNNFADYVFGPGESTAPFRNQRAAIAGNVQRRAKVGPNAKMNRREFFEAVGDAMLHGDEHPIPQVAATAREHRALYDRLFEEAKGLGIIREEVQLLGDTSFLNRIYNQDAIARNPNKFLDLLTGHMNDELQKDFSQVHAGYSSAQARDTQRLQDMNLPLADAKALQTQYQAELKALDSMEDDDVGPMEDLISSYRSEAVARAKEANKLNRKIEAGDYANSSERSALLLDRDRLLRERNDFREEVGKLQGLGGPDLAARAERRGELKRRLRNLNRNQYFVQEKYRKKFDAIESLEEANIDTTHRAIRSGHAALQEIDAISDKSQQSIERASKALDGVVDQWVNLGNKIEALKAKPENADMTIENPDAEVAKLMGLQEKQDTTLQRLRDAQENLRSIQNIDRTENGVGEARGAVQEAMDAMVEKLTELNNRRAKRMAKLEKGAEAFDEKAWKARQAEIADRIKNRATATHDKLHAMGADDADLANGTADFKQHARDIAESAMEKIQGTNMRLAGFDAMQDARGTELARTLSIPSDRLTPYGFLSTDAEHLIHAYGNTLVPDIELVRRFGPFAPDGALNPMFKGINEEERRVLAAVENDARRPLQKDGSRKEVKLSDKEEKKLGDDLKAVGKEFSAGRDNLTAIIMRLRHQWGVPKNPNGFLARGTNVVLGLQAMRLLGGVMINSIADVGRPIMRYGLQRTVMNAWVPMINNWKAVAMSMQEAQRAFVAVETMTADRAHQMADLLQNAQRRSMGEAALEWGVSKIGVVAGFSPWTDVMKTLSTMTFTSKVLDSLEIALRGAKGDKKEATEFLASLGWNNEMQERIWKQVEAGGGEKIKGTWVPQTDRWTDKEAVRSMRAATNAEAAATIITPGVEVPKFMNSNPFFRILMNLKSFGMASTSKTTMAALQQRDMAVINGVFISLALGGLSRYLIAQIAGGSALERYMSLTPQQHVQEAIDQSGLLGAITYGTQLTSDLTAGPAAGNQPQQKLLKQVRDLVGAYNIGDPGSQIIGDVVGPSAQLATLLVQAEASGHWTPAEIHRIRQLLPLQNLFYLRKLFDAIENAVGGDR